GWDDWHAIKGTALYYNYYLNDNGTINYYGNTEQDYLTDVINRKALAFIDTPALEPFLMVVGYVAPHGPITPAKRHLNTAVTSAPLPPNFDEADVSDKPAWVQALPFVGQSRATTTQIKENRTMLAVDESIRDITEDLAARGKLDNTVIIFMTDNGFAHGSHRWWGKIAVYEESIRTPLLIRYPGAGQRSETRLVSNIDIAPTITEIAGASPTLAPVGLSLVPLLTNVDTVWRDDLLLAYRGPGKPVPNYWAVRTQRWKYSELATAEKELYDLDSDPYELENLANRLEYSEIQSQLAIRLQELKR
ncbi:MAG: sulfatase/phosphatase domain-containing protein, partial [Gammaproteobacteria bacterium]